jgi:hypothetical protein
MIAVKFPQANTAFKHPDDLDESQCFTCPGFHGKVEGGSLDGVPITVTAWKPEAADLARLNAGEPIFLAFLGGLPPHLVGTTFDEVTHPA